MREAAQRQDGVTLFRSLRYDEWEADMLTGCVCYEGWKGYDCSEKQCPMGSDPLYNGNQERQTLRSTVTHRDEVQLISIGGGTAVNADEVQTITILDRASGVLSGTMSVSFDTSAPACALCPESTRQACTRPSVTIDSASATAAARASATASTLQTELLQCANIDTVTVTGAPTSTGGEGIVLSVTFGGLEVGGNVPQLQVDVSTASSSAGTPDVVLDSVVSQDGDEVQGDLVLSYDDSTSVSFTDGDQYQWPPIADQDDSAVTTTGGAGTAVVTVGATASEVKTALEGLPGIGVGGLAVEVVHTGGPGIAYRVTFASGARQRGNRPLLAIDAADARTTIAPATNAAGGFAADAATHCATSTVQHGTFMSGTFRLGITYDGNSLLTSALDWNASPSEVSAAIQATDTAIGNVQVTRTRYPATPADDWSGGYEWGITFRGIPENLPTMTTTTNMLLDGDPAGGSTAGASVAIVADSKQFETQRIRTDCTHQDEVQVVALGGNINTDEVQRIRVTTTSGYPEGVLFLGLDTSTGCTLCKTTVAATSDAIEIGIGPNGIATSGTAAEKAAEAGINMKWQLENMPNIDDVQVSASLYSSGGGGTGYEFLVTFSGVEVGGNIPLMTASGRLPHVPSTWTIAVSEVTAGVEVSGSVVLSFDDSSSAATPSYPTPEQQTGEGLTSQGSDSTGALSISSTPTQIKTALEALDGLSGTTIDVAIDYTGMAGLNWVITFSGGARARGNRAALECAPTLVPATATCTVTDNHQQGTFLNGTFKLSMTLNGRNLTTQALAWDSSAADIELALERLFPNSEVGQVDVARAVYAPSGSDDWVGGFDWTVTFIEQNQNLAQLSVLPNTLSCLQSVPRDGGVTVRVATLADGSGFAQVNEVQILECTCAATCTGSVKLSLLREQTAAIQHDATASDIREALEGLEFVPTVSVNMAGGTSLCDADGVTTAITFTHNPIDVPALTVDPQDDTAQTLQSTSGTTPTFQILADGEESRGEFGFKVRTGTRVLSECSNRGTCESGSCRCFKGVAADGPEWFGASNNAGGDIESYPADEKLGVHNCGYSNGLVSGCPSSSAGECSGHGTCSGAPNYVCTCSQGFSGAACEAITCPSNTAWFDEAWRRDTAHYPAACSEWGRCDGQSGRCLCRRGYRDAVDCSLGPCPGNQDDSSSACQAAVSRQQDEDSSRYANPTSCKTMGQLAAVGLDAEGNLIRPAPQYTGWDADMWRACQCSGWAYGGPRGQTASKRSGYGCNEWTCPAIEDPRRGAWDERQHEVQSISCTATGGSFQLEFEGVLTSSISHDAFILDRHNAAPTVPSLEGELQKLVSLPRVRVELVPDPATDDVDTYTANDRRDYRVCGTSKKILVTLLGSHGDPQLMRSHDGLLQGGGVTVLEEVKGTKYADECSRRGVCDRSTGKCSCMRQYGSSDGDYGPGLLGDCGHLDTLYNFPGNAYNSATKRL